MLDNDQRPGRGSRDADHPVRRRGVRIGRTAITGWVLAAVLVLAGFGTAMGATPVAVAQPLPVADTTETTGTAAPGLDPLSLLPTERVLSPTAVLPNLPTIASVPDAAATATETATPPAGAAVASVPAARLRTAAFTTDAPDARAAVAIRTALAQIGLPYVWGGNGPTNGDAGFDCSGLTTFSYGSAGVPLPRTAHTQYNAGPHVPDGAPLQPGDLVFYGTTARVHHVGMYLGAGRMVNAPTFGKPVQVAFYRYNGDDYLGATRPAAAAGSLTSGILPFVDASQIPVVPRTSSEQIFRAPTAPMPAVLPQPGDTLPPEQVTAAQAVAESDAVAITTAAARSAAVAGATTSTSAPVTTAPAATDPVSTGTATSTVPSGGAPVAGTTTTTVAPVTSAPAVGTAPQVVSSTTTATSTTTQAPVATKTTTTSKPAASTTTNATTTTKAPATTTKTTEADVVTTSDTTTDDETSTTKTTTKTTEKTTEEAAEEAKEVKTEDEDSGDSEAAAEEAEDSGEDD